MMQAVKSLEKVSRRTFRALQIGPTTSLRTMGLPRDARKTFVRAVFGDRAVIVRPGLLVGPYDPTNRFTYWVDRFAEGGDVAVAAPAERYVQFIDVRDAAAFMIRLLEEERSGIYDVNGLQKNTTMDVLANTAIETLQVDANVVWIDEDFLEKHGFTGWVDLPLWIGPSRGMPGFMNINIDRALAARSLNQAARRDDSRHTRLVDGCSE